jgi:hypothetical protein
VVCADLKPRFRSADFEFRSRSVARTRGRQPGILPISFFDRCIGALFVSLFVDSASSHPYYCRRPLLIDNTISHYRIVEELGGEWGVVKKAEDVKLSLSAI